MSRTRPTIAAAAAALLLLALTVVASPATARTVDVPLPVSRAAGVDDFTFRSMDVDYTLGRADDGTSTLKVVETFVAEFPDADQNHGMRRSIPDTYNGQPLFPQLVSITDGAGAAREAESDDEDGAFTMTSRAPQFVHGAQTYVFTYTLRNVIWDFPDTGEEFYWDVNGVDSAQPYGRVSATLHLAPHLADALSGRQACYQGPQGSTQTCDGIASHTAADGSTTVTASATGLQPHETLTMAVGFRDGTFALFDSSYLASPAGWVQGIAGLGMLGALVLAIVFRVRRLRDAAGRPTIIAEYTPPPGVDALEGAVLLGERQKAVPAEVLEQAIIGAIRIVEGERKLFGGHRLQAELVDASRADENGRMLLAGMFGANAQPGSAFEFGQRSSRFASAATKAVQSGAGRLAQKGLRRAVRPGSRALPILLAVVFALTAVGAMVVALGGGTNPAIPVLVTILAVAVLVAVVVIVSRSPLSAAGAETRDHLLGLKLFIEWAEADRIRMLQSPSGAERVPVDVNDPRQKLKLYEALLPYAVVFGQEKQWSAQLAVMYGSTATPYWYVGTGAFDASAFSSGIATLSAAASSSSSTSGGSGGGGSAGGGGGGGGAGGV